MQSNIIRTYNFYMNSSQRTSGNPQAWAIQLPQPLTLNGVIPSQFTCFIDRLQVPFSWSQFSITANNVQVSFVLHYQGNDYEGYFELEGGNYDVSSIMAEFSAKLQIECGILTSGAYEPVLSYTYSQAYNHLRITLPQDNIGTRITFSKSGFSLSIGFGQSWTLYDSSPYTESTQDVCMSPSRSLYITSSNLKQIQYFSAIESPFQISNVIGVISIDRSPLLFINYKMSYPIKTTLQNTSISVLDFNLRDEQNNALSEMLLDWSLHLVIQEERVEGFMTDLPRMIQAQHPEVKEEEIDKELLSKYKDEQEKELQSIREKQAKTLLKYLDKYEKKKLKTKK